MERTARRARPVYRDHSDSRVQSALQDLQDQREPQADSSKSTAQPDLKEHQEPQETRDPRAAGEEMDPTPEDHQDQSETMAAQAQAELQAHKDLPASPAHPESQEAASTAHPHVPHQGINLGISVLLPLLLLTYNIPRTESKFINI